MLEFRQNGDAAFKNYVKCYITKEVVHHKGQKRRHKKFHGFGSMESHSKRKPNVLDTSSTKVNQMLKKQIEWCKQNQMVPGDIEQFIKLPLVIANSDGTPYKGQKAKALTYWKTNQPDCFITQPINQIPNLDYVILEGMFIINTTPLPSCFNFQLYAEFLFKKWLLPLFRHRAQPVKEVHVVFDCQEKDPTYIKICEQNRRDQVPCLDASAMNITDTTAIPPNLRNRASKLIVTN